MSQQRTLSRLTSTLTKFAPASPLTSTLTKTKDLKSFNINTYKKGGGGRVHFPHQTSNLQPPLFAAGTNRFASAKLSNQTPIEVRPLPENKDNKDHKDA